MQDGARGVGGMQVGDSAGCWSTVHECLHGPECGVRSRLGKLQQPSMLSTQYVSAGCSSARRRPLQRRRAAIRRRTHNVRSALADPTIYLICTLCITTDVLMSRPTEVRLTAHAQPGRPPSQSSSGGGGGGFAASA